MRSRRPSVALIVLLVAVLGLSGCGSSPAPVQVLADKGTPYSDLLVPKVTASVQDGAIGVPVENPVTVTTQGGVLGSVSLVDAEGESMPGQLSPDGVTWTATEPLAYNGKYTLTVRSLGLGGSTTRTMAFTSQAPENLTVPYLMPNDGEVVGVGQPIAVRFDENIPDRGHHHPAGRGCVLLAQQS